jgi:phosphoribosylamine--glycine ligase
LLDQTSRAQVPPDSERATVYHAGTARVEGQLVTSGGRVLAVTGVGSSLEQALAEAYATMKHVR